ncbi:MAG TPA: sterol desaturase family protein [Thermoanaerobaculia bacterium]|nr:sterol desaturase family protein [Thermoanaerobaculia bacterium]
MTAGPRARRSWLDERFKRWFGDEESTRPGSGWATGVTSVVLGGLGLGAVLCLHFPALLTSPELRAVYPMTWVRGAIETVIGLAFLLGLISAGLRRRKVLAATGMGLALVSALLGGGSVPVPGPVPKSPYLGLDWFLLNVVMLCVVFVPLERIFPLRRDQAVFRPGWTTDSLHFLVSHLLVQVSTLLTLAPATVFFAFARRPEVAAWVAAQPGLLQFVEIVLVADLAEYAIHRAFHRVSWLWPFHEVHHSSREMDWLAGSRLHLVDVVMTRGFTFLPIYLLGFAQGPVYAYLAFVSIHAVFIHANVRLRFGWLERLVVTPHFHHWHHSAAPEAVDKNFAVHLPWLDRFFGTCHAPAERWPDAYGTQHDRVPEGYPGQLAHPFRKRRK